MNKETYNSFRVKFVASMVLGLLISQNIYKQFTFQNTFTNYLGIMSILVLGTILLGFLILGYMMNARSMFAGLFSSNPLSFFSEYIKGIKMGYDAFNQFYSK